MRWLAIAGATLALLFILPQSVWDWTLHSSGLEPVWLGLFVWSTDLAGFERFRRSLESAVQILPHLLPIRPSAIPRQP